MFRGSKIRFFAHFSLVPGGIFGGAAKLKRFNREKAQFFKLKCLILGYFCYLCVCYPSPDNRQSARLLCIVAQRQEPIYSGSARLTVPPPVHTPPEGEYKCCVLGVGEVLKTFE